MRLLGVDFGGAHIGLAVTDSTVGLPRPLKNLAATGTLAKDATAIVAVARSERAERIVVGLPLSQGEETRMSKVCRQLAEKVSLSGFSVALVDESLTSFEAESAMRQAGMKASEVRKAVDGEAACRILLRFMEENGSDQV